MENINLRDIVLNPEKHSQEERVEAAELLLEATKVAVEKKEQKSSETKNDKSN